MHEADLAAMAKPVRLERLLAFVTAKRLRQDIVTVGIECVEELPRLDAHGGDVPNAARVTPYAEFVGALATALGFLRSAVDAQEREDGQAI